MLQIPLYVYFLFIFLMYLGFQRCFPRTIQIKRLFTLPLLFVFLSLHSMVALFDPSINYYMFWILGIVMGIAYGYFHIKDKIILADHKNKLIHVPGDWVTLMLIFAIFMFEFFINVAITARWKISQLSKFEIYSIIMFGLFAGITIGRNLTYGYKYIKSRHQVLSLKNDNDLGES